SGIDELHRRVTAQRQALLATVLVAVEDGPRAGVLGGHPQRQPRCQIVEIIDPSGRRWFQTADRRVVKNPTALDTGLGRWEWDRFRHETSLRARGCYPDVTQSP